MSGETFFGQVQRILFVSPDANYAILQLDPDPAAIVPEGARPIAVGPLAELHVGQRVRLTGHWKVHPPHGVQLEVESYVPLVPERLESLERYLGSGCFPGIGETLARRLVHILADRVWPALERDPQALAAVPGMGLTRAEALHRAWLAQRQECAARLFLADLEVSADLARRLVARYGPQTEARLRANPYLLAMELRGVGFKRADDLARRLGVSQDSVERAVAAVRQLLLEGLEEGHVYLPLSRVLERAQGLGLSPANALRGVAELESRRLVIPEVLEAAGQPPDRALYLKKLHRAERGVAEKLRSRLTDAVPGGAGAVPDSVLCHLEDALELSLTDAQRLAVRSALGERLLVITGGPGTGKTTLVRVLVAVLRRLGLRFALSAPTGRAARRLMDATGAPAITLHRLLEAHPPDMQFKRNRTRPLEEEFVLVDEASMVDLPLFDALLEALPAYSHLVLVGDAQQLPPVGPGDILGALLECGRVPTVRLEQLHRQAAESGIAQNARRMLHGFFPIVPRGDMHSDGDFFFLEEESGEAARECIVTLVSQRLPSLFGLDPLQDVQVLSPSHRGVLGVAELNARLQEALNGKSPSALDRGQRLRVGDKVLQTRNHYEKELFNGDLGRVLGRRDGGLEVSFEDRRVLLSGSELDDLELAYCMTVHKAQGSEFPAVVIPLSDGHSSMLRRSLLYTAITRARTLVVLVGSRRALERALARGGRERRYGRLAARLSTGTG